MNIRTGGPYIRLLGIAGDVNTCVFFYGLYMDSSLLEDMGYSPELVGTAKLNDYQIHIGNRATLIPAAGTVTYGILMELPDGETEALYSRPEVSGYEAEPVQVNLLEDDSTQRSICYILPQEAVGSDINTEYANKLADLVVELGFPSSYADEISRFGSAT